MISQYSLAPYVSFVLGFFLFLFFFPLERLEQALLCMNSESTSQPKVTNLSGQTRPSVISQQENNSSFNIDTTSSHNPYTARQKICLS